MLSSLQALSLDDMRVDTCWSYIATLVCRLMYLDEALARQFTTAVRVGKRSKEAGKTIAEVGLRGINGERASGGCSFPLKVQCAMSRFCLFVACVASST
jgi:hypothetical protein